MRSLTFRIWVPFAILSGIIVLIIAFYYSSRQEDLYIKNRRFELQEIAKSVALAVELSLEHENLEGLQRALALAKSTDDFEKVALVINDSIGKKIEFLSNPVNNKLNVVKLDSNKYIVEKHKFKSEFMNGEIYVVSSKVKIDNVIAKLNLPLFQILLVIFLSSIILFYLFARWLVRPIKQLINYSKSIESNKSIEFNNEKNTTNEIQDLGRALISLSKSLGEERNRNEEILASLEKQVIERTRENRELSLVARHALNGVIIADKNRRIVWANESLLNITGYTLEELQGKSPKIFQFEKTNADTLARIKENLDKNQIVKEQILNRGKHGKEYWLELNIVPVFEGNDVTGYIAVETDITDRINDEDLLRKSEELNRRILENASEMIHTLDENGNILWANNSWLDNLGVTKEETLGQSITNFLNPNTLEEFGEVMPKLMAGELVSDLNCIFISKGGKEIMLKGKTIPLIENGKIVGSQAYLHNVTNIIKAQEVIREKSDLQDLIMRISTKYINLHIEKLDETILESLRDIASFVKADRAYIFDYIVSKGICEYKYEWTAAGILSQMDDYKQIPLDSMPYWYDKHSKKEFVIVEDANNVEEKNIREMLLTEGIKSLITIPIHDDETLIGFVGFDLINSHRIFSEDEKDILILFSQMLVNVYKRLDYINELNKSKKEIEDVNASLEQRVLENTRKNLDLSKSIIEQEKFATIGEISAGIAHDLNTPLGTIKVGADNVRFMLGSILRQSLNELSNNDLKLLYSRVENSESEMFVGGLQLRREKIEMFKYMSTIASTFTSDQIDKISDLLVKARVKTNEITFIHEILNTNNPHLFADLLYQVQSAVAQLDTIKKSSDKAVKVVQDVRSFIKGEASQNEKRKFNLRENISTVLGVFNYELKQNVDLKFEVDSTLEMEGYDVKLFQLWSNLIKNAFEAMDEQEEKYMGIYSSNENGKITLTFENNGPKIPDDVRENMFKKFYTTKAKKSGSGLGLSIVTNILTDHNAEIEVYSDEQVTRFIVTFMQ
jgi:PAS domain S-box-containing protein